MTKEEKFEEFKNKLYWLLVDYRYALHPDESGWTVDVEDETDWSKIENSVDQLKYEY